MISADTLLKGTLLKICDGQPANKLSGVISKRSSPDFILEPVPHMMPTKTTAQNKEGLAGRH